MPQPGMIGTWPRLNLQIAWNLGGTQTGTPYWTDVTGRLQGQWNADQSGRQYELDAIQSGSAKFVLDNTDSAFDSTNAAGPWYGSIKPFRRLQLLATWPPTQNLLPQGLANGTSLADFQVTLGTSALATGLTADPAGHTTAQAWTLPASAAAGQACGLGATNASWGVCDSDAVPVIGQVGQAAGQPWTFSVYTSVASGGTSGLAVNARISWYNQAGSRIATSDGTVTTMPAQPAWTRLTVSATAPAGAVWLRPELIATATTTATTLYATGWQAEQAAAATAFADPGVTEPLWSGYLERTKQTWPDGPARGTVDLQCVDALAGLSRLILQPSLAARLQALGPSQMYALNEPAGSTRFADGTGKRPARVATAAPAGNGGGSITAGNSITGTGSVGNAGPVVTLTNPNAGVNGTSVAGVYLLPASGVQGPPTSGGWTRIIAFRTTTVPAGAAGLWIATATGAYNNGGGGSKAFALLYIDHTGKLAGGISDPTNTNTASVNVTDVNACDGNWHIAIVQLSADGTVFTVACDNFGYQSTAASGTYNVTGISSDVIGAVVNHGAGTYNDYFQGDLAYAVEIPYAIGNSIAYDIGNGFTQGWSGDTSAQRAQRLLTMAGYPGMVAALGTQTVMGPANVAGTDAVSALQVVADSENGQLYVDPSGTVTLAGRKWRYWQTAPVITFGENTAGGEIPYLGGEVAVDLDPDHIYNTIDITNQAAQGASQPPDTFANNAASQAEYFPSTLTRTINVADPNEPPLAATYLAAQYAEPQPRISKVTIDPSANPALWPALLQLAFGARAKLMRRPNAGAAIGLDVFVERLAWKGNDQGQLRLELQLSAGAPYIGWWTIASLHTTLQAQATSGTNTVTLGALTGAANNPAAAVLAPGTALVVGYGTAGAETVTVQSVAATSPGYTSVAVTLTANLAGTHAAGQTVCQPLPGGVTLPAATAAAYPASLDAPATLTAAGTSPRIAY